MRVLVCGGRNFSDTDLMAFSLGSIHKATPITCIIEGGALGADRFARRWAVDRGVWFETFPADWDNFGKRAGPIRNGAAAMSRCRTSRR